MNSRFCEGNSVVEFQLPKLTARVRSPSLALIRFLFSGRRKRPSLVDLIFKLGTARNRPSLAFIRFSYLFFLILITGCVSTTLEQSENVETIKPSIPKQGVYHKVGKGQTVWRIAKAYNVSINDVIVSNSIPNVAKLEENQLIFIPGADKARDIPVDNGAENAGDFSWPIKGKVVSYFRESRGGMLSNGIEIVSQEGDVVKAARAGKVVLSDYLGGYDYTVILDHMDGFYSVYARNAKLLVKVGDSVPKGSDLGYLTKKNDSAYCHFEIRKNTVADNPLFYLP